jgi:hypothetical protein
VRLAYANAHGALCTRLYPSRNAAWALKQRDKGASRKAPEKGANQPKDGRLRPNICIASSHPPSSPQSANHAPRITLRCRVGFCADLWKSSRSMPFSEPQVFGPIGVFSLSWQPSAPNPSWGRAPGMRSTPRGIWQPWTATCIRRVVDTSPHVATRPRSIGKVPDFIEESSHFQTPPQQQSRSRASSVHQHHRSTILSLSHPRHPR